MRRRVGPAKSAGGGALTAAQIQALINEEEEPAAPVAGAVAAPAAPSPATSNEAALEAKKLKREMEILQRDVTLGRWDKLAAFLGTLPEKDQVGAYEHLLKTLPRHPNKPRSNLPPNLQERNRFTFEEAFILAGIAPKGFGKKQSKLLAPIVKRAIEYGSVTEEFIRLLGVEISKPEAEVRVDRREAAMLLASLSMETELGAFLPTATVAEKQGDREALNLLARYSLAMYAKEKRHAWLEKAWEVTQAALAKGEIGKVEKEEALRRAVELAPKVDEELGPAWLADSFTDRPERGMEIIATIGRQVATGFQAKGGDTDYRSAGLKLQKTAVEALLRVAPELAEKWRPRLAAARYQKQPAGTGLRTELFEPFFEQYLPQHTSCSGVG